MDTFLMFSITIFGVLVGGIVGVALSKWPAKSVLRNVFKGAVFGMGSFIVLILFAILVSNYVADRFFSSDGSEPGYFNS
jgi:hypothetical protein